MEYLEFLCAVETELNEKFSKEIKVRLYQVCKNNGSEKQGILIESEKSKLAPAIYLEEFYAKMKQGKSLECIVQEIWRLYQQIETKECWDVECFDDYEEIKGKIVFRVINTEKNAQALNNVPFINLLDLSIVFYVLLNVNNSGAASIQIQNEHLKVWQVNQEELYNTAIENVKRLLPAQFFSMHHAISEMLEENAEQQNFLGQSDELEQDSMYILTNSLHSFGAACLFYPHLLEMIGDLLMEDYFVLPSSIHEVIIVPKSKGMPAEEMDAIIVEINDTQVEPEEVLSDHVYFYERAKQNLMAKGLGRM